MVKVLYAHKRHPIEPLGLGYIASSIARGGHESRLELTEEDVKESIDQLEPVINEYNPGIFAQSIIFGSHLYAAELSREIKKRHPEIISILGGPAGTFTPELLERGFDAIVRYEGENPFLSFCDAIDRGDDVGNIPNFWVRENSQLYHTEVKRVKTTLDIDDPTYKEDQGYDPGRRRFVNPTGMLLQKDTLEELPFPDREFLYSQEIYGEGPIKHFMHTRGCAWKCAYCFNVIQNMENKGKGKSVRQRLNEKVVAEINEVKDNPNWPMELVYFQDDVFGPTYRVKDMVEFADVFSSEVGLPFHAHVRFDHIARDPKFAEHLARAGCSGVHAAIESGNDDIRNRVHRRDMSTQQVLTGADYLTKNGIRIMTQNILGAPEETEEQMFETLELNLKVAPTFASASIFQPYPGTSALEHARDIGVVPAQSLNELIDSFGMETFYSTSILIMDPNKKKRLEALQRYFAIAVENPEMYHSGELHKRIEEYEKGNEESKEFVRMYRQHRAEADERLYGVKLDTIVAA
jgi:anaerobic magnesium-protoporphyrin IX monomethyl ester cyclase